MGRRIAKKVLWIGWDAADWKAINPLLDKGLMPNLEKMINEGTMGNLATLDPPMSPTLWTAMSTGKRPYKHGIYGFTEIDPTGEGVRPSYITSRKVKAIWNMLMHHDMKTHQVGWWPSHPAEPIDGIYISNFWHKAGKNPANWPLKGGCVHPKTMEDIFKELRVHPQELTHAHLQPFIPFGHEMDQNDPTLRMLINMVRKITADAASIQAAATYILDEHKDFDLMCVYFDAIDHYGHGFMKYNPPRRPHIDKTVYKYFNYVITAGYRYHDMILGRLLQMAGDDTTVFLVSDHGFHPDHLRPSSLPIREEPAAPALEHSPYGIIVAKGPGIKTDEIIFGASLIDMCPTILSCLGLPVAKDFDGKVLTNLFEEPMQINVIDSWEDIEGDCGQHQKEEFIDIEGAKEEMQQLIDLGYIEDPGDDKEKALEVTRKTNKYFMARAFADGGRLEDALPLYEELWEEYRDNTRFGIRLANCYMSLNKLEQAKQIVDDIFELKIKDTPGLNILKGTILMQENKLKLALEQFEKVKNASTKKRGFNIHLAKSFLKLKKYQKAKEAVMEELEYNYENPEAHRILANIYESSNLIEHAVDSYLTAIGLKFHFPIAHHQLGMALIRMNEYEKASQAFQLASMQFPEFIPPRKQLIRLYETHLPNPEKVAELQKEIKVTIAKAKLVYIVTGLRRSGTSLMMDLLNQAGAELYVDDSRPADKHNPSGYYEHKDVSAIRFDKRFLKQIPEKHIVKIYAKEIPFLPTNLKYKIISIDRDSVRIMESRTKQQNLSIKNKTTIDLHSMLLLHKQKNRITKWMDESVNIDFLEVNYEELLENPKSELEKVASFLDISLNTDSLMISKKAEV